MDIRTEEWRRRRRRRMFLRVQFHRIVLRVAACIRPLPFRQYCYNWSQQRCAKIQEIDWRNHLRTMEELRKKVKKEKLENFNFYRCHKGTRAHGMRSICFFFPGTSWPLEAVVLHICYYVRMSTTAATIIIIITICTKSNCVVRWGCGAEPGRALLQFTRISTPFNMSSWLEIFAVTINWFLLHFEYKLIGSV